ncbi:MAG TPA: hypothetical protein VD816_18785, partial [Ohtaekwangia sp.]|nr:hypothetical protein [Ohtaekwangia sp.]
MSKDGTIYAGGFNELGTINKDEFGKYHYTSLIHLLRPEDRNLENIWQIHEVQGHMVFRSYRMLIAIANGKAFTLPASDAFRFSTVVHDTLYVIDREAVKSLDLNSLEFVHQLRLVDIGNEELVSLLPGRDDHELLAVTKQGSFFKFYPNTGKVSFWQKFIREDSKNLVTCAIKASTGNYYLGTLSTRIISLDAYGRKIPGEGFPDLQDNTVLNLFESREGNIWALLNNGLDCIDVTSPVSLLFENASIYDVLLEGRSMYLATNQGMFVSRFTGNPAHISTVDFEKISGLEGQAWAIHRYEGKIICSHDRGIFILSENGFRKIRAISGVWKIIPAGEGSGQYLVCTYEGIWLMTYDDAAGFVLRHKLDGFNESSRDILQGNDPGIFWVCHGYKGVFRIKIDDQLQRVVSVEHFKDQNGLPSPFNINVARWNNEIVFTTNNGIFTYDNASKQFKPHTFLTGLLGDELNVRKLLQHGERTWFVHDNEVGYFMTRDAKPKLEKGLFLQLKGSLNASMECIVPVGSSNVLIGTNTGLYAFDLNYNETTATARTTITRVSYRYASAESFCPLETSEDLPQKLPYKTSGILFHFSAPAFRDKLNVQFCYLLEDVDDAWSPWQVDPVKEYSMLRPGKYVFRVRARSLLGESAQEARYYLEVLPLWYQTAWAYFFYTIGGALIIAGTIILIGRKIRKEREKTQAEERE